MSMNPELTEEFAELLSQPDEHIDLARGALLIARMEYPELAIGDYLERLDRMAEVVRERLGSSADLPDALRALNQYLFVELGFAGNIEAYFDPRNSFLNDVLERKLGIPISLSVIYMEIGRRIGLPLMGVSFPGHFLVKLSVDAGEIVLDPFSGGLSLSKEDLEFRLHGVYEPEEPGELPLGDLLEAASKRDILVRMLRNLKAIYLGNQDLHRALNVAQRLLLLEPGEPREIRDRGLIYLQLECFRPAAKDLERYLREVPQAEDAEEVRARYINARRAGQHLH